MHQNFCIITAIRNTSSVFCINFVMCDTDVNCYAGFIAFNKVSNKILLFLLLLIENS